MAQPNVNPMQMTQQHMEQMQNPGFPMMNLYGNGYDSNNMPAIHQQFVPDFIQMYMAMGNQANMGPGMPPPAMTQIPEKQPDQQTPPIEDRDSGNDTLSPILSQQHSNSSSAATSPQFPGNADPFQQQMAAMQMQVQQNQAQMQLPSRSSPYDINSLLNFVSEKPSQTDYYNEQNKENEQSRKSNMKVQRRRRETPFEKMSQEMVHDPMAVYRRDFRDQCAVCADNATGYHYGAMSCEGCKGFFRRHVTNETKMKCLLQEKCRFSFENCVARREFRTCCSACRFARCLEVGMEKEKVRKVPTKKTKTIEKTEEMPPKIYTLTVAFQEALSTDTSLTSVDQTLESIRKFISAVPELKSLLPQTQSRSDIEKFMPGLMAIRAAFTLDTIPFHSNDNSSFAILIGKLRNGIRNTVLMDEGLAILSGIHILQLINGGIGENFDTYCNGLRNYILATRSQEPGTSDRLLSKLGLLL